MIKSANYLRLKQRITFSEMLLVSRARLASGSWSELREVLSANTEAYGIDISENSQYAQISVTNRQTVFYNMLRDVAKAELISDISASFKRETNSVAEQQTSSNKNSGSSGGGGSGGTSSGIIAYPQPTKTEQSAVLSSDTEDSRFLDIGGHFSQEAVEYLTQRNIITGYPDQSFRSDGILTRAEFANIIYRAFGFQTTASDGAFSDVAPGDWFYEAVSALSHNDIISSYNSAFYPGNAITRQDAAVILKRVLDAKEISPATEPVRFEDASEISDYAVQSVDVLSGAGVIQGYDGLFRPRDTVTRGEAAVMLYRMLTSIVQGG